MTVCHSRTRDLPAVVRQADILIAAIGKMEMVRGDWIKPGAAVIDVGINEKPDATKKKGYRLVGDVNFEEAAQVAGCITPVPGGVGPMTIAMLMRTPCEPPRSSKGEPESLCHRLHLMRALHLINKKSRPDTGRDFDTINIRPF